MLTGRRLTPEHMDHPDADPDEQARALRYLRRLNRGWAGVTPVLAALDRLLPAGAPFRLLDVGTGSADIPLAVVAWARRTGRAARVTGVDSHPVTLELARRHVAGEPSIELVRADARRLMDRFAPGDFDVAHASLFLHHLEDIEVVTVLRIMDRLADRGVIWNDLVRGPAGRGLVRIGTLAAPRSVKHDARVSVDAGFTRTEALDLAARAGLESPRWRRHLLYRFTVVSG
jgi:SAM-dependent methyltransferase